MESCGVSQCENGGELWMCVTIRFPMLPGSVFSIELTDFLDSDLSPQSRCDNNQSCEKFKIIIFELMYHCCVTFWQNKQIHKMTTHNFHSWVKKICIIENSYYFVKFFSFAKRSHNSENCLSLTQVWVIEQVSFIEKSDHRLKLPEDEVIDIKCKPQDPAISGSNVINFQENAYVPPFIFLTYIK